jgi:hypothetical protein
VYLSAVLCRTDPKKSGGGVAKLGGRSAAERVGECVHDSLLLVGGDLRVERKRQDPVRRLLGVREVAPDVAELAVGLGEMDRGGVVHPGADALGVELADDVVAVRAGDLDDVQVPDVEVAGCRRREYDPSASASSASSSS